jgi:D-alanyl-D-alanine carboxypeptidase/D-alanyl-D-alanine-endopeptidase (penicillin-binding protein 4)
MSPDTLSVFVQDVGENTPLLAVNSNVARNPASTIKLLTTLMALEDLGPAYTWKTEAYLRGELHDGTLEGDLFLKGYGDPYMVIERYWLFLRRMKQRGLHRIAGDLVIDNAFFDMGENDTGEFDGQGQRIYNVVPDAFLVNFQAINFTFFPSLATKSVMIVPNPSPANLEIENRLRLTRGLCGGFQNGIAFSLSDPPGKNRATFSGSYRGDCQEYNLSRSVLQAETYAYGVFRTIWQDMGGELTGGLRVGSAPEDIESFVVVESPPLAEIVRSINKWSNNVMARHLLLTMGAERFGSPATVDKGREAAAGYLAEKGLDFPELKIDNGAGLSRTTTITADHLGQVLLAAHDSLYSAEFIASLPLSGLDGTLRKRFVDEGLTGRMHVKTGRLTGVFAMAGYVRAQSGGEYVVVAIQNHPDAHRGPGEEMLSELLRWVARQ